MRMQRNYYGNFGGKQLSGRGKSKVKSWEWWGRIRFSRSG